MVVVNCPALENIYDYEVDKNGNFYETGVNTYDYCIKHKKQCNLINECIVKQIINGKAKLDVKE